MTKWCVGAGACLAIYLVFVFLVWLPVALSSRMSEGERKEGRDEWA